MKNGLKTLGLFIFLTASTSGWALTINTTTDVGGLDTFLESADLDNSGFLTEEAWIQSILGSGATLTEQYDSIGSDWTKVDGETDVFATKLKYDPEYFFIKIGTGGTGDKKNGVPENGVPENGVPEIDSHYLFENKSDLKWAVVDFSEAGIDFTINNIGIGRMSHVGEIDATNVPEPATLALLGLGLVGLGLRKRFN